MRLSLIGLSLCVLFSCGDGDPTDPDDPSPPDDRGYDALSYDLVGSFDWTTQQLTARETITVKLTSSSSLVVLDAAVTIDRVTTTTGSALQFTRDEAQQQLTVDLSTIARANEPTTFVVEYHAATAISLIASRGRDDDPVTSRVVFTNSEPDYGLHWLVAHHHPSDRALFSVELTVPANEDVIGNGTRIHDKPNGATRTVRYELDKPIPTYLMAFAAGEIDHVDRAGDTPLSIWYRRGLFIDPQRNLDVMAQFMTQFEALLGPYPWDTYSVVLVPSPFGGGMENATITFNAESSGLGALNIFLHAHELAHQWFGDWVTMHTYQDVWVKEGLATLLESEAERPNRGGTSVRLFGIDYTFLPEDAIVDKELQSIDRYTSGPYQRAAWLITQVRAKVGEDAFWSTLRKILADHALGTLTGEQFLRSFAPRLTDADIMQLLASLERKETPEITITQIAGAGVSLALQDPAGSLLLPMNITVVSADGVASRHDLAPNSTQTITVPLGGYLAPDEDDLSPPWTDSFNVSQDDYLRVVRPLMRPVLPGAGVQAFTDRSAGHQERALPVAGLPAIEPAQFDDFYHALDSTRAQRSAELGVCSAIRAATANQAEWIAQMATFFNRPATSAFTTNYSACGVLGQSAINELTALIDAVTPQTAGRLNFLLSFDYGTDLSLDLIGRVATNGPTLLLREQALSRLASQARSLSFFTRITNPDPWIAFFRGFLTAAKSQNRFQALWLASFALGDRGALPIAADKLKTIVTSTSLQRTVVCNAFMLTGGDADWQAFRDRAQPWTALSNAAQDVLGDPARCQSQGFAASGLEDEVELHEPRTHKPR